MTLEQLLDGYREAAIRQGNANEIGDHRRGNRAYKDLVAIKRALRRRGEMPALLALLDDEDAHVRVNAAADALSFAPDKALPVLAELAGGPRGEARFNTAMILKEWHSGRWQEVPWDGDSEP